jgi:hypothetical protein
MLGDRPRALARRWTTLAITLAAAATAALLLITIDPKSTGEQPGLIDDHDELQPRGEPRWTRPLALEPVCGEPARPAAARGCSRDELLGFSLRLGGESLDPRAAATFEQAPLYASVFGIAADGELLYYTPTPIEPARTTLRLGAPWQALPLSVRLEVNHEPGRVRVFALASDAPADVRDIERWAAALQTRAPGGIDDPPWHLRLGPSVLGSPCRTMDRCASAETELTITNSRTDP